MASGSGLATALAAIKGHAAAAAVIGTLVVGGGAATVAVTTGAVEVPGISTHHTGDDNQATPRAQACTTNGDAARLAAIYAPMFGGSTTGAQQAICKLFTGSGGHAYGLGEVQQILETTAAIERNGNTSCLTASSAHGQPTQTGKPADPGHSGSAGTPAAGQPSATIPSSSTKDTTGIIDQVTGAAQHGTPLAQLAHDCGATPTTGNPSGGTDHGQPTTTPGAKPSETPGAKPTGTPGHGHP
jgi:hypothetical protein